MPQQYGSPQNLKGAGKTGDAIPGSVPITEPQALSLAGGRWGGGRCLLNEHGGVRVGMAISRVSVLLQRKVCHSHS